MMEALIEFAKSESVHGLVAEQPIDTRGYWWQAERDWSNRLNGGEGCWAVTALVQTEYWV